MKNVFYALLIGAVLFGVSACSGAGGNSLPMASQAVAQGPIPQSNTCGGDLARVRQGEIRAQNCAGSTPSPGPITPPGTGCGLDANGTACIGAGDGDLAGGGGGSGGGSCPPYVQARRAKIISTGCGSTGGGGGGSGSPRDISQGTIWQNGQFEVLCGMYSAAYDGTATVFGINSVGQKFAGTLVIPKGREQWGFLILAPTPTGNAISIVITGPAGTATCGGSA